MAVVLLKEHLVFLVILEQRFQAVYLMAQLDFSFKMIQQIREIGCHFLPGIQSGTHSGKQMGMIRGDDRLSFKAECADKGFF